ncbi:hypothetical protein [Nocardia sp. bgisy134]
MSRAIAVAAGARLRVVDLQIATAALGRPADTGDPTTGIVTAIRR